LRNLLEGQPLNQKLIDRWAPVAICLIGLVMAHHEMVLSGFAVTQNDLGDTRFVHYLLEHALRWTLGQPLHSDFWSPPFFAPSVGHLAWSENMAGAAWVYFPFRLLLDPHDAFQAWGLALGVLNFAAAWLLLKRGFSFSSLASSVGAALFAFSAVRVNQTMHWQLFPHFYTPVALYALLRLSDHPQLNERARVGHIALLAAAVVGQLWASIYLGWFLVFVVAIGLLISPLWMNAEAEPSPGGSSSGPPWARGLIALGRRQPKPLRQLFALLRQHPYTLLLVGALSIAALYPMAWRYLAVEKEYGGRPIEEALTMLPMPFTWLHMGHDSWLWGWLAKYEVFRRIPMEHEQRCGFGLVATALAAFTFIKLRKERKVFYVGVLLLVLLLITTLYAADGTTPWRIVHSYFPAAKAIRAVSRASIVYMLGISVGVAAALTAIAKTEKLKWAVLPLGALLVFEQGYNTPAFSKESNRRDIAAVSKAIEPGCEVFLMSPVQGYGPYWKYQLDAMWASMMSGIPTLNGYSGQNPKDWALGEVNLRGPWDEQRVAQAAQAWLQSQKKLEGKKPCWVRVGFSEGPNYSSEFVSQQVPPTLKAGESSPVELTFKNTGPKAWPVGVGIRLGAESPQDNDQWGMGRVELPQETAVGQTVTFRFNIRGPQQLGKHAFQWRLVHDGVQWIGATSTMQVIEVMASDVPPLLAAPDAGG
jgi:hypothetical protein